MLKLRDIMTADVVTLSPETTLREAADILATHHVGGAPVMEDGGRVVGVVSQGDLLAFEASAPPVQEPQDVESSSEWEEWDEPPDWETDDSPPARFFTDLWVDAEQEVSARMAEPSPREPQHDPLSEHMVSEIMTRKVLSLPPDADVSVAAERMRSASVHRVLVIESGRLLGIVTTMDLTRAVADGRIGRNTFVFERPHVAGRDRHRGRL